MIENRGACRELFALTTSTVFLSFVTSDLTFSTCVGQAMVALRYTIKEGQYLLQKKNVGSDAIGKETICPRVPN